MSPFPRWSPAREFGERGNYFGGAPDRWWIGIDSPGVVARRGEREWVRALAESDDRTLFDCGRESLNVWSQRHAWANQTSGASRVNVVTDAGSGRIVGYVTLSAAQIERAFLPEPQQCNRPDPVPVTLLGQLAVDGPLRHARRGRMGIRNG
jgi:hypothetical protein